VNEVFDWSMMTGVTGSAAAAAAGRGDVTVR